jgi:hypothetical protein
LERGNNNGRGAGQRRKHPGGERQGRDENPHRRQVADADRLATAREDGDGPLVKEGLAGSPCRRLESS